LSKAKPKLLLDWATHEAAKHAVQNWHYSANLPTGKMLRVGVWESGSFVGVVVYGLGATPNLLKPYGLKPIEGCELIRIALRQHQSPVSKIIAVSLKFLKKKCPGLRLVVSFADPNQGHHGGVYQASNWIYSGKTQPDRFYRDTKGNVYHARQVSESGNIKKQFGRRVNRLDASKLERIIMPGKHRYLMPLDDEMRRQVQSLAKPYPKRTRAVSKENVAATFQVAEGGANPTTALQIQSQIKAEA
jgi:hypothetical protein